MKIHQNLCIGRELSGALEAVAAGLRGNKCHLVNDALKDCFACRRGKEFDELFKVRLDFLTRKLTGARRDSDVLVESLSLLVRYQLRATESGPGTDVAARAIGRARFEGLVSQVGRHLAGGKRTPALLDLEGGAS